MFYYVDTANVDLVKKGFDLYPLKGVTMNPTIVLKDLSDDKKPFFQITKEIQEIIGDEKEFHIQVVGETTEEMVLDAEALRKNITGNLFVKIPATSEGYKAIRLLKEENINTTATAVISVNQALLSAKAGASYVAPYVNRISNISNDGDQVVRDIVLAFKENQIDTQVIGASFKNVIQVQKAALAGVFGVAVGYDTLKNCANHELTESSVEQFTKDWEMLYGKGKRIYNL